MVELRKERIIAELVGRSKERGSLERGCFVIGSGGGGVEREGLGKLGGGGERHCWLCVAAAKACGGVWEARRKMESKILGL